MNVAWNRLVKRVVALTLITGCLGFYADRRFRLRSSYAVIAAPAITIRAPTDGVLTHSATGFSIFERGALVATLKPAPITDPNLRAVRAELDTARASVTSLKALIAHGEQLKSNVSNRQSQLGSRRTEHLKRMVQQAETDLSVRKTAMEGADLTLKRSEHLCQEGLAGTQDCENARTKAEIERRGVDLAAGQLDIARFLLDSTRSGVDVAQDIGSEVTYARQQRDELAMRLAVLTRELATEDARVLALEQRANPPSVPVTVSSRSRVWSVLHQSDALTVKGDPLFEVVDCEQLFVFVALSEDRYESLRIGMTAKVTVGERVYAGTVAQLLGPYGTFSQDRRMEPQPPVILNGSDAGNAAAAVAVPALQAELGPKCEIGTRVEVELQR